MQTDIIEAKLQTGKRGHKTELTWRSPLRGRKSALDCSAISGRGRGGGEGGGREEGEGKGGEGKGGGGHSSLTT